MIITKKSFYCIDELMEFINTQGFSTYKATLLLDQAVDNYGETGKWYIELALPKPKPFMTRINVPYLNNSMLQLDDQLLRMLSSYLNEVEN
jgi:hypothetical protein